MTNPDVRPSQGIGARVQRKEDDRFMRGRGQYVSDIAMAGLREIAFLRSPLAHARIKSVGKPAGKEADVFTWPDLSAVKPIASNFAVPGFNPSTQTCLASEKVRFAGEAVAMAVAESRAKAEDLVDEIDLELEELGALVDATVVRERTDVRAHEHWPGNLFHDGKINSRFDEAAAKATVIVENEFHLSRQVMNPMEGKAVLAHWDSRLDQLVVYTSTQVPHMIRWAIAEHLQIPQTSVRVISPDVGGAFGYKCVLHPEELCVAWLAWKFKAPFRWTEDRREHLTSGANCREHHYKVTAYADERGKLLAVDADITIDAGAYSVWPFTACLEGGMAAGHLPGPYKFEGYRARFRTVSTNKPAIVPYRGVARTGICFAMELTIDAVARKVGREPWEVRRDNLLTGADMPHKNPTGKLYDSGDYSHALVSAADMIDVGKYRAMQAAQTGNEGKLVGVGFGSYIEMTGHGTAMFAAMGLPFVPGFEQAFVRFTPDGQLEVRVGVHSHGQGMETTLAQIAHEELGIDISKIKVIHGDTAMSPFSTGTYASRSITMAGGAVARACRELRSRLGSIAAHLLGSDAGEVAFQDGAFTAGGKRFTPESLASVFYLSPHKLPAGMTPAGLEVTEGFKPSTDTGQYSYGTHAVAVEVDTMLGTVRILDYVIVEDCGRVVNPLIVEGQTLGGLAQGLGTALYEEARYDANGQPMTSTLADYILPGACEMPKARLHHTETPSPNTEYGIKGVGEGGAIPPPAAIFNAVNDALKHVGVQVNTTPLSPHRLREALMSAGAA